MQNKLWYNRIVSNEFEKKDQPLALRVPLSLLKTIEKVAEDEDRPVGYVARELMVRGLALYQRDGHLRDTGMASLSSVMSGGEVRLKPESEKPRKRKVG